MCNGLVANVGFAQVTSEQELELALLTAGDDVAGIAQFLSPGCDSYTAKEVIHHLLTRNKMTEPANGRLCESLGVPELAALAG